MKKLLFLLIFLSIYSNSQIIKDTVLGKPKSVKEYVVFLNESRPYTFMQGDGEYGHAAIMEPKILRRRMSGSWFESNFCRYINNETYYDENRKITKETWFYKSGRIVNDYNYTYDNLGRLIMEKSTNDHSENTSRYFYDRNSKNVKFKEDIYKQKNKPTEKYINNLESSKPLFFTKFDTLSKTDSIFAITNDIWKKYDGRAYTPVKDSIYQKKLSKVKKYDDQYRIIEEKLFNYSDDYENKRIISLYSHKKYEYDKSGNLIKQSDIKDGKLYSYVISGNGKLIQKEKSDDYARTSYTLYSYDKDNRLERIAQYYNDKLQHEEKYEYKNNYISKLYDLEIYNDNKIVEPTIVIFKYKFDKQKNWTEIIKNVNGKDLYKWVRKIEYY